MIAANEGNAVALAIGLPFIHREGPRCVPCRILGWETW